MTMYWLYDLPTWLFGLISISFFNVLAVIGLFATRKWVRRQHLVNHSHNDIVSYFLAAVTVFYGITLGLLAVGAWTNYSQVESRVDTEAQGVASMYRDVCAYPEPTRDLLRQDLRDYVRNVVEVSWPQQRQGIIPENAGAYIDRIQQHITAFSPATPAETVIHAEGYRQFNALVEARRARLNTVQSHMPRALWSLVVLGALITLAVTLFFDTPSFKMHLWLTLFLATLLGLMIYLIGTLDSPFRGRGGVSPAPLQNVYRTLIKSM